MSDQAAPVTPTGQAVPVTPTGPAARLPAPDGVPDKFWDGVNGTINTDGLLKSYTELESRLSAPEVAAGLVDPNLATPDPAAAVAQPGDTIKMEAGDQFAKYREEYTSTGALSPESIAELGSKGFSKDVVDNYVAGVAAQQQALVQQVYESVGGKEQFEAIQQFAQGGGLTAQEVEQFNAAADSSNPTQMSLLLGGIKAKMTAAQGGSDPTTVLQGSNSGTGIGFGSQVEYQQFLSENHTRYQNDTAFRNAVQQRLRSSPFYRK